VNDWIISGVLSVEQSSTTTSSMQLADVIKRERRDLLSALQFKEIGICESSEPFQIRRKQ
jgi:hypothetical protein